MADFNAGAHSTAGIGLPDNALFHRHGGRQPGDGVKTRHSVDHKLRVGEHQVTAFAFLVERVESKT